MTRTAEDAQIRPDPSRIHQNDTSVVVRVNMLKMIQMRDVADLVHSTFEAREAREGMSLSAYRIGVCSEAAAIGEWLERT